MSKSCASRSTASTPSASPVTIGHFFTSMSKTMSLCLTLITAKISTDKPINLPSKIPLPCLVDAWQGLALPEAEKLYAKDGLCPSVARSGSGDAEEGPHFRRPKILKYGIIDSMTTAEKNKKLGNLVEQKILEFFGDPDAGLDLKRSFVTELRKRMAKKQKLTSHAQVLRKYGLR